MKAIPSQTRLMTALSRLEEVGVIETLPTGEVVEQTAHGNLGQAAEEAALAQEHHRDFTRSQIEMMRGYAELWDCRRRYLLNYFGEELSEPCGSCDNCQAGNSVEQRRGDVPFPLNSRVVHTVWGEGLVERYEGDTIYVLFDDVGYKTLDLAFVTTSGALTAMEEPAAHA